MSKLTLQFEGIVLKEYVVGNGLTIGRLPDNAVIIDNPAVSGHHARVYQEGERVVVEDLRSTNGTFVNGRPVTRHVLQHMDEMLVGKHQLVFDRTAVAAPPLAPGPALAGLGDTVYLDTKQHRALRATLESARADAARSVNQRPASSLTPSSSTPSSSTPALRRVGVLRVVSGRAEQDEYDLGAHTSLIGRSDTALVRLKGWFKPSVAVAIAKSGNSYVATALGGKPLINEERLEGRYMLQDGDVLRVSGLVLEFRWKDGVQAESAA
jgi:pSer/pThr/pTyr-binding forkhead associated (FHA) protein